MVQPTWKIFNLSYILVTHKTLQKDGWIWYLTMEMFMAYEIQIYNIVLYNSTLNENNITDDDLKTRFYKDAGYIINHPWDKKSNQYKYNKNLETHLATIVESGNILQDPIFLSSDPNELMDRLQLLYQEKNSWKWF